MHQTQVGTLAVLATHINGAADSGKYGHITTEVVKSEISSGGIFAFLARELGADIEYALGKLTDTDRHVLSREWLAYATHYETYQFHVRRGGLPLLAAYVLHGIYIRDYVPPR
jgi:hypothetical protein